MNPVGSVAATCARSPTAAGVAAPNATGTTTAVSAVIGAGVSTRADAAAWVATVAAETRDADDAATATGCGPAATGSAAVVWPPAAGAGSDFDPVSAFGGVPAGGVTTV